MVGRYGAEIDSAEKGEADRRKRDRRFIMADQLCLPQLDPYHLFVISINGVLHKDTTVYSDREFEMILDQYDGYLPRNLRAYHFSSKAGPGPTIKEAPTLSIPVYKLGRSSSAVPSGLRLYSKNGFHSGMPVERRQFDFVWTRGPSAGGLIAYIDGIEYSLLSQYHAWPILPGRAFWCGRSARDCSLN